MNYLPEHPGRKSIEEMLYATCNKINPTFEFLVRSKAIQHIINPNEEIVLKRALSYRIFHLIIGVFMVSIGISIFIGYFESWQMILGIIAVTAGIYMALKFFNNNHIMKISATGLLIDESIFNRWTDIEYLYFEREDGGENTDTNYLVECLKNGYKHRVDLSGSGVSKEKLGDILYAYMKKYSN